jgi:hypothetical protein
VYKGDSACFGRWGEDEDVTLFFDQSLHKFYPSDCPQIHTKYVIGDGQHHHHLGFLLSRRYRFEIDRSIIEFSNITNLCRKTTKDVNWNNRSIFNVFG